MALEKGRFAWGPTAALMAVLVNMFSNGKGGKVKPDDFNPYMGEHKQVRKRPKMTVPVSILKDIFCKDVGKRTN